MHLALEKEVYKTLPCKSDAAVKLHGPAGRKARHVTGRGLGHERQAERVFGFVVN